MAMNTALELYTPPQVINDQDFVAYDTPALFSGTCHFDENAKLIQSPEYRTTFNNCVDPYWFFSNVKPSREYSRDYKLENIIVAKPSKDCRQLKCSDIMAEFEKELEKQKGQEFDIAPLDTQKRKKAIINTILGSRINYYSGRYLCLLHDYDWFMKAGHEHVFVRRKNLVMPQIPQASRFI